MKKQSFTLSIDLRTGELGGLYCDNECLEAAGKSTSMKVSRYEFLDEDNPEFWEQHEDGCCTPMFGHCCAHCREVVWTDEDI